MSYKILAELIEYLEQFEEDKREGNLSDFILWINSKLFTENKTAEQSDHDELAIAFKVMYLNKGLKRDTKHILSGTELSSIDEYSFLLHLNYANSFRKMELVELHNMEAPTGIEIIKRLLRNGLISEYADNEDRRAKRIKITGKGASVIQDIAPQINSVFSAFTETMAVNDKVKLSGLLNMLIEGKKE